MKRHWKRGKRRIIERERKEEKEEGGVIERR